MSLITGKPLNTKDYFSAGNPVARGSSVDLTVGCIFGANGEDLGAVHNLKPGHMVQVVSAEVFNLPDNITAHVTYKTTLTRQGIWALTVGIVDPGWKKPIATTLLNFSKNEFPVKTGEPFLRVSLFKHAKVDVLPDRQSLEDYLKEVRATAMSKFSNTFLDQAEIAKKAGDSALDKIRTQAVVWVGAAAFVFATAGTVVNFVNNWMHGSGFHSDFDQVQEKVEKLQDRVSQLESLNAATTAQFEKKIESMESQAQSKSDPKGITRPKPESTGKLPPAR